MRGIKPTPSKTAEVEKAGDSLSKAKHRLQEQEDGEDSKELPRKKQKCTGKRQQTEKLSHLKSKSCCRKKNPSSYEAGSLEEQWHMEILDKGRITCPVCRAVARKTVEGLKKHMANCRQEKFTCHHCGKQLRSLAGIKYHVMADHNSLPVGKEAGQLGEPNERERLRKVLKRMGKLKCTREGCAGNFTSVVGYLYHTQKCGKAAAELEKMALKCPHCSKAYQSKAGLVYHLKSEHGQATFLHEEDRLPTHVKDANTEPRGDAAAEGGRIQRRSAKVAAYHLHELANEELVKEWPKRKVLQDLVPDDRKLKYTRPRQPTVSPEVLCRWKSEIKMCRRVHCPNQGCEGVYSSISGLKSHLGSCTAGEFVAGKYQCLLCAKEFVSESGVKYHINTVHAEDWFDVSVHSTKSFEKLVKLQQVEAEPKRQRKKRLSSRSRKRRPRLVSPKKAPRLGLEHSRRQAAKVARPQPPDCESRSSEEEGAPTLKLGHRSPWSRISSRLKRLSSLSFILGPVLFFIYCAYILPNDPKGFLGALQV
ncbi:zinc finger protein 512 isoform X2 [Varanus komodoensis]|uniref:zinc finger protein 512 isoform X2 n=1 Tax=Varanus komodoensis TaxID=61221 RepID=UPI001CF7CBE6|nr:zinc finger protein 512 isoform X2 [Varanus komodoensis]XP_044277013.1 zinc finger protein 512 isoform X2 [Varanus komodoensis]